MSGRARLPERADAAALLGVDAEAAPAEVQRAFLRAARRVHPDVLPDADEGERRAAEERFGRLLAARDALLVPAPAPVPVRAAVAAVPPGVRRDDRGLAGSLVVLALLAFLLVLLVTVEQGLRGEPTEGSGPVPATTRSIGRA